jgi:site-specific DNA-methyltransferase (adenine-specific)
MLVENQGHIPDILDCIANLSSDEVFTPPDVASQVLDLLPKEIWSNPELKILDPCTKTGIFLRESARRLMVGLEKKIPDETERREHIFKNMLFGIAITELTGLVARRSLYYSKDAKNDYSVVQFEDSDGNIQFKRMEHNYVQGKCKVCGSPYENLERGDAMENYAYQFIHEEVATNMKFDVVVGNPPYQVTDGGGGKGSSASPLYHLFVNQAFRLKPRYVAMIIPARWFSGGKGLDSFRTQMLASKNFQHMVYYPDSAEIFPGPDFGGGVCYFLWDEKYEGYCKFKTIQQNKITSEIDRYLDEDGEVFVSMTEARPILKKVLAKGYDTFDNQVSSSKPFAFRSNFKDYKSSEFKDAVKIYLSNDVGWIKKEQVTINQEWIGKWKVLVGKAYGERGAYPYKIIAAPRIIEPNSVCSETYLVCGVFSTKKEAELLCQYIQTRFFRFMLALQKNTQNVTKDKFGFIPILDYKSLSSDEALYKHFGVTKEEQSFIEGIVRELGDS